VALFCRNAKPGPPALQLVFQPREKPIAEYDPLISLVFPIRFVNFHKKRRRPLVRHAASATTPIDSDVDFIAVSRSNCFAKMPGFLHDQSPPANRGAVGF